MKKPIFEGVATALVTPFKQGTVDFAVMNQLLDLQLAAGVDAVVVCGTTGEASTMTDNEKLALIAHTVKYCAGRCKIIAGTGTNDTAHTLQLSRVAASMGVDAVLLVTPYYNKCTQAGLIAHYTAAADTVPCPVIVYNVPSRTGVDVSVETCRALWAHPNIGGIKEASGSVPKAMRNLDACAVELTLWSGNDDLTVPLMAVGAAFDYHAGLLRQPPPWMQRAGLEWFWRLGLEPRRLWRRYVILNPVYLARLAAQKTRLWAANPPQPTGERPATFAV